jgi:glycosyltransferase involved in cell wall biosynthesis
MATLYYPPHFGGGGLQAQRLARLLARAGVRVSVLSSAPPDGTEAEGRLTVHRFRTPPRRTHSQQLVFGLRAASWLLAHRDWQLLHLHAFAGWSILPVLVAHALGRPVLCKTTLVSGEDPARMASGRSGPARLWAAFKVGLFRSCDAVVALSEELEAALRRDGRFRGEIVRIPNGVDTELFRPASEGERRAERASFGLAEEECVVVAAGALIARKNPLGLIEAARRRSPRRTTVVLAGPTHLLPDDAREVEAARADLPNGISVRLLGELEPEALARLYRASDVFVLNSFAEGMPNSLLEGMASGLPCIATDVSGSRDLLAGGAGLLVPAGDTPALARALERLDADPSLRARLGAEGRSLVENDYSLDQVAHRYRALYASLLERRGTG